MAELVPAASTIAVWRIRLEGAALESGICRTHLRPATCSPISIAISKVYVCSPGQLKPRGLVAPNEACRFARPAGHQG
jgi:hypothetical protein